ILRSIIKDTPFYNEYRTKLENGELLDITKESFIESSLLISTDVLVPEEITSNFHKDHDEFVEKNTRDIANIPGRELTDSEQSLFMNELEEYFLNKDIDI